MRQVPDNTLALPDNKCPTLEEWIALACLVGADVCVEVTPSTLLLHAPQVIPSSHLLLL